MAMDLKEIVFFIPHAKKLGLRFVETDGDAMIVEMPFQEAIVARKGSGIIANGAVTTMMDTALGAAVFKRLGEMRKLATLDLRMDFLRPCLPNHTVYSRTECIRLTREVAFARGVAWCDDPEKPVAQSMAAFSIAEISLDSGAGK
ncbi:PaaI family thioesterase [Emcibacter sp.]|uniref:PaaI family thioesterase n=1 Tax=Emcibacter sp. TaxID=1979954 RepID=UPI003A8F35D3